MLRFMFVAGALAACGVDRCPEPEVSCSAQLFIDGRAEPSAYRFSGRTSGPEFVAGLELRPGWCWEVRCSDGSTDAVCDTDPTCRPVPSDPASDPRVDPCVGTYGPGFAEFTCDAGAPASGPGYTDCYQAGRMLCCRVEP